MIVFSEINCLPYGYLNEIQFEEEQFQTKWFYDAQDSLHEKLNIKQNKKEARNVIIFLGDGMSVPTVTAARIHLEQRLNLTGHTDGLEFDKFSYSGLSKTYCADSQVADSACSATAYLGGVKGNFRTIGVTEKVKENDCKSAVNRQNHVSSIAEWAQKANKLTGIVTTTRVTHASPAGNYAHISNRNMESDLDIIQIDQNITGYKYCKDIAKQLIEDLPGRYLNVIMGGGRQKFLPIEGYEKATAYGYGERLDGEDLIQKWYNNNKDGNAIYVSNRNQLLNVDFQKTDHLLGLFADSHMKFNLDNIDRKEPSLAEMTASAIEILQKGTNGFYLFVEGGHIDIAHHSTLTRKALDETIEFSKAIRIAKEMTSSKDTLIVVTADHSHTMSISGYSTLNNDILGLNSLRSNIDGLPYATLSYANGPDTKRSLNGSRINLEKDDINDKDFSYPSNVPLKSETHGGDDVPVFASGPWAHLFSGTYEQNLIPHLMGYAACIGSGDTCCRYSNKRSRNKIK
ncbi:alkaline phosphatase-like [Condylostylus longicornis]|uniref:alkaline phosphatase-like n=1 Tax=Condylostylus longicornis TaxID=2530218 RepID=UPI00244DE3F9|nr:alkaline phosphatase-like [Condylostylus longicornis]